MQHHEKQIKQILCFSAFFSLMCCLKTEIINSSGIMYNVINRVKSGVIFSQTSGLFWVWSPLLVTVKNAGSRNFKPSFTYSLWFCVFLSPACYSCMNASKAVPRLHSLRINTWRSLQWSMIACSISIFLLGIKRALNDMTSPLSLAWTWLLVGIHCVAYIN